MFLPLLGKRVPENKYPSVNVIHGTFAGNVIGPNSTLGGFDGLRI